MLRVTADVRGLREFKVAMLEFSNRRLDAAMATALTRTAVAARNEVKREMVRVFDRPTPFTLNSLWIQTATGNASTAGQDRIPVPGDNVNTRTVRSRYLEAMVYVKDDLAGGGLAKPYLLPQVEGGSRPIKRFEKLLQDAGAMPRGWFAIPGNGARLDRFGNMRQSQIVEILSRFRAFQLAGSTQNRTARSTKRRAGTRSPLKDYFASLPNAVAKAGNGGRLPFGIYERKRRGEIVTVLRFRPRVGYRERLDFYGTVQRTAARELPVQMRRALAEQWARLQAKRAGGA